MNKDELMKVVMDTLSEHNGDKHGTLAKLNAMCQLDDELMVSFAKYGHEVVQAMNESISEVLH